MNKSNVTIHDLAKELNINASTVSRALNNHPAISKATRKKVLEKAAELNYKPNTLASSLRKGKRNTIGIIVPRINRSFFADAIHGIEKELNETGYNILICQTNETVEKEIENINTLINNRVDGIILSVTAEIKKPKHIENITKNDIPLVMFDRIYDYFNESKVVNDDFTGSFEIVKHLIKQGYKNIAHFSGPQNISIYRNRLRGYLAALKEFGIPMKENFIKKGILTKEMGIQATKELFTQHEKPDAIFSAGDYAALGALITLKSMQIKIPDDVGVAGYANEPFTEFIEPSLTSVDQYSVKMGSFAAQLMLDKIEGNDPKSNTIIVNPSLILRNSTKRNNSNKT